MLMFDMKLGVFELILLMLIQQITYCFADTSSGKQISEIIIITSGQRILMKGRIVVLSPLAAAMD